ncbi:KilA-N domain-containing protein [Burkholderia vietnamiensis]|uniref:KilA-N domain-containing protein n=1 Tax=Burkholderia vietnamiensis TaxID=60552 RepID=UPI00075491E2|nr:KilA-N domain-containing protein [Burkholderia vietnamiensis]KVF98080.1 DNA-binding protein [Burkholderia vietnamiensis]MDN8041634.1 KilA-N domain-containing protein [Burkholderia vietnamiensis]HDR9132423.1 KilA-N domain-containing protein [Burkholderia vietnamiensis]HDR9248585.1 KilA-N domain-containing protein [Burkholderia vietnamiensis]
MATTLQKQKSHTPAKSAAPTTRADDNRAARFLSVEFDGEPVQFTADGWINATQVAKRFGKHLDDWLRSPDTNSYMDALARAVNSRNSRDLIRTKRGRTGYTLLHPKLAVLLARWCDVDFAVWCDLQIDHILRGGVSLWRRATAERSDTTDREPLLTAAAAIVARHRLPFGSVYEALDLFVGVAHAREMTCEQVAQATEFGERLLSGNATPDDFAAIERNRAQLGKATTQLPLIGGAA